MIDFLLIWLILWFPDPDYYEPRPVRIGPALPVRPF